MNLFAGVADLALETENASGDLIPELSAKLQIIIEQTDIDADKPIVRHNARFPPYLDEHISRSKIIFHM